MLAPWKKNYDKPREHIKKQRHYFADMVPIVKDMVFPVVTYICQSWTIKEGWVLKNWCFWTVVLEKTLGVPWTARRSNKSILKEINPKYSLDGLMLKVLMLQYFGHLMLPKSWLIGKDPDTGKERRQEEKGMNGGQDPWMASPTQWTWVWTSSGRWWRTGKPGMLQSKRLQRVRHDLATEQQQFITTMWTLIQECTVDLNIPRWVNILMFGKTVFWEKREIWI